MLCIYTYVYIYMYIYTCIYIYVHINTYTRTCILYKYKYQRRQQRRVDMIFSQWSAQRSYSTVQQTSNFNQRRKGNLGGRNSSNREHVYTYRQNIIKTRHVLLAEDTQWSFKYGKINRMLATMALYIIYIHIYVIMHDICWAILNSRDRAWERKPFGSCRGAGNTHDLKHLDEGVTNN